MSGARSSRSSGRRAPARSAGTRAASPRTRAALCTSVVDSFEELYAEGGRMMSVGLHGRIVGRPGRAPALDRFLAHVRSREHVWVTTRAEIARHWHEQHAP